MIFHDPCSSRCTQSAVLSLEDLHPNNTYCLLSGPEDWATVTPCIFTKRHLLPSAAPLARCLSGRIIICPLTIVHCRTDGDSCPSPDMIVYGCIAVTLSLHRWTRYLEICYTPVVPPSAGRGQSCVLKALTMALQLGSCCCTQRIIHR